MDPVIIFNNNAKEFMNNMINMFPHEVSLKTYFLLFQAKEAMDPKSPCIMFMENLEPFGEQIMTKNEKFFKDDQYVNKAESISGKMGLIKYWESLNEETKDNIWKYVQILYVSGMKVTGKTDELKILLQKIKTNV